ncbi:MAG: RNA pseudouridine synthase, partial [Pseudomonadales bacterium]|nr:RNA pseudouridine synthase [Pseudomonadales bacterium]
MSEPIILRATIPAEMALLRLDRAVSDLFPQFSRARLQSWIKSGELTVDGELRRPRDKVIGGEEVEVEAVPEDSPIAPEPIELSVLYEDESVIVIDKPVGLVVHPGAGNRSGTLLNGLLYYDPRLASVPRAGIVHRLDKDTSGLLVVARTLESQNSLVQQLQARTVSRIYEAVVYGV